MRLPFLYLSYPGYPHLAHTGIHLGDLASLSAYRPSRMMHLYQKWVSEACKLVKPSNQSCVLLLLHVRENGPPRRPIAPLLLRNDYPGLLTP